jgi:hypothetical protein
MKSIQISDELYDKLKDFVVDPFDDSPESVITRLLDIAGKAKNKWSVWDGHAEQTERPQKQQDGEQSEKQLTYF